MSDLTTSLEPVGAGAPDARLAEPRDYIALMKPRVMSLVVFTALIGMLLAPGSVHPVIAVASIFLIAIGAGASGALNMGLDADIDHIMRRTRGRPIPRGRVGAQDALVFGGALSLFSVMLLGLTANFTAAALLAVTIAFYTFVYTLWLKRRTPQNIVVGGAAGAFPPMIGWAVVSDSVTLESLVLFALIFLWTPPHFWALSLYVKIDYEDAGIPMLPVTHGVRHTRWQIFLYSLALMAAALAPVALGMASLTFYGALAFALSAWFVKGAWDVLRERSGAERGLFRYSIYYLFLIFSLLAVDAALTFYDVL